MTESQRAGLCGLMTDIPPCRCPAAGVATNCVHHGAAWKRIGERLGCTTQQQLDFEERDSYVRRAYGAQRAIQGRRS